ncbi:MAG: SAM-dependent chlorinase/fluorinase [Cyanobacteria bacterium Co-bin13]|nr:SAM-dependent chlorinase/fluorinase [Cyanobacteria bacterium Co-bin13]
MAPAPLITLLTDFGTQDAYVGIMKGVIAQICPQARVIDLTHDLSPQDLLAARFNLLTAYPYFPAGTIHVAVVDPGVGTARRGVVIQTEEGMLVGPDNGIFSGILATRPGIAGVSLTQTDYWRTGRPSTTFHGRDIFAPVAAHLAKGVPISALGDPIELKSLTVLEIPAVVQEGDRVRGSVQHCDRFGNLITNLTPEHLPSEPWQAQLGEHVLPSAQTYGDVLPGQPLALIGSHGWLEISVNGGSAEQRFQARVGMPIWVQPRG